MGGGLMQLVAYGAQDIYLTGNPQITFFKVVYRRHTNFSMECIEQTIQGTPADSGSSTVTVSRNGDLIGRVYVTLDTGGINRGSRLISEVELEIGGQLIDRQYSEWMDIWAELTVPGAKRDPYKHMICDSNHPSGSDQGVGNIQVPLHFWFCRNPGCYLPLIALQYHEVKLKFTWGATADYGGSADDVSNSKVCVDYVYLDTDERRRFAQVSHEYLIEQIQRESNTGSASMKLNFNHPVKELIWTDSASTAYGTARLTLNGHDRFSDQQEEYFQIRQPYDYHTAVPNQNLAYFHDEVIIVSDMTFQSDDTTEITADNPFITAPAGYILDRVDFVVTTELTVTNSGKFGVKLVQTSGGAQVITTVSNNLSNTTLTIGVNVGTSTNSEFESAHSGPSSSGTQLTFAAAPRFTTPTPLTASITTENGPFTAGVGHIKLIFLPDPTQDISQGDCSQFNQEINVYSFALKPEEHQPSGTCNFSRIDSARLVFGTAPTGTVNIYAVNYNVLRIMSGMGGLAYSN